MRAYRRTRRDYALTSGEALSGRGGMMAGGRWHSRGQPIVYAAASRALAMLEYLVHLEIHPSRDFAERIFLELDVPDPVHIKRLRLERLMTLDPLWRAPGRDTCRRFGDAWLLSGASAVLMVPSAVLPREANILLNPRHPDFPIILRANTPLRIEDSDLDTRLADIIDMNLDRRTAGA